MNLITTAMRHKELADLLLENVDIDLGTMEVRMGGTRNSGVSRCKPRSRSPDDLPGRPRIHRPWLNPRNNT
jgi:hypothetical protein